MDNTDMVSLQFSTTQMRVEGTLFDAPMFTLFDSTATDISFVDDVKYVLCVPPSQQEHGNICFIFYDKHKNRISGFEYPPSHDEVEQNELNDLLLRTVQVPYLVYLNASGKRAEFTCDSDSSVFELAHGTVH